MYICYGAEALYTRCIKHHAHLFFITAKAAVFSLFAGSIATVFILIPLKGNVKHTASIDL